MSQQQEATINPDGTTTFETPPVNETADFDEEADAGGAEDAPPMDESEEILKEAGVDPAIYLLIAVVVIAVLYYLLVYKRKANEDEDKFFSNLDGEKFNLKLPAEVDEYYNVKEKCLDSGWEPGKPPANAQAAANGPHRIMAQALMKRAIADLPIVQHIQKESAGMNKLYAQSMCSVKQWRSYQAAEAMVSAEVEDVRAEADEIEPGWSQVIWRQAMQYHTMLKQKHEQEAKAAMEAAAKKKEIENKVNAAKNAVSDERAREIAAEKAAEELIKAEEREKQSKKSFKEGGMKKGFLDSKGKKK